MVGGEQGTVVRFDRPSLAAQVMLAGARALPDVPPGAHASEVPLSRLFVSDALITKRFLEKERWSARTWIALDALDRSARGARRSDGSADPRHVDVGQKRARQAQTFILSEE